MANFTLDFPQMDMDGLTVRDAIRKIASFQFKLYEQMQYMMMHLDEEILAEGAVTEKSLSPTIKKDLKDLNESKESQEKESKKLQDAVSAIKKDVRQNAASIVDIWNVLNALGMSEEGVDMENLQIDAQGNVNVRLRSIKLHDGTQWVDVTSAILALMT